MSKKPKKPLTEADQALWDTVKKTVKPLDDKSEAPNLPKPKRLENTSPRPLADEWHLFNTSSPDSSVDKKLKRKITKGLQQVDRSIDLHGLNQEQAFRVLLDAITACVRRGDKVLLVVTGKGGKRWAQTEGTAAYRTRADFDQFGGVLKRMVPQWLNGPELRPFIQSFDTAAKEHGGDGAMYVVLRKRVPGSKGKR